MLLYHKDLFNIHTKHKHNILASLSHKCVVLKQSTIFYYRKLLFLRLKIQPSFYGTLGFCSENCGLQFSNAWLVEYFDVVYHVKPYYSIFWQLIAYYHKFYHVIAYYIMSWLLASQVLQVSKNGKEKNSQIWSIKGRFIKRLV